MLYGLIYDAEGLCTETEGFFTDYYSNHLRPNWGLVLGDKNIAWGSPVINVALIFNLITAFYIPLLCWGILRGNRPRLWLFTIPILVAIRLWIDTFT